MRMDLDSIGCTGGEGLGVALVRPRIEEPEPRTSHFQLFAPSTAPRSNPQETSSVHSSTYLLQSCRTLWGC